MIDHPDAVKFSTKQARIVADRLAQAYSAADAARDRWGTDLSGTAAEKIVIMGEQIRDAATRIVDAYQFAYLSERAWFLGFNNLFPNTAEEIADGSGTGSGRPLGTGTKVHGVMARAVEAINWLLSTDGSFATVEGGRQGLAYLNTVLEASHYGPAVLSEAAAGNAINRFTELATNYEASANQNLNSLLAFAPNPQA